MSRSEAGGRRRGGHKEIKAHVEGLVSSNGLQQILNSKYYVAWSLHVICPQIL